MGNMERLIFHHLFYQEEITYRTSRCGITGAEVTTATYLSPAQSSHFLYAYLTVTR